MVQPRSYYQPRTISVTFRIFLDAPVELDTRDEQADAQAYVRDELLPQVQRVIRGVGADVADIEWDIDEITED